MTRWRCCDCSEYLDAGVCPVCDIAETEPQREKPFRVGEHAMHRGERVVIVGTQDTPVGQYVRVRPLEPSIEVVPEREKVAEWWEVVFLGCARGFANTSKEDASKMAVQWNGEGIRIVHVTRYRKVKP